MALCEEEVGEVDFGGFLGRSGVVFKEGADTEVEVVSAVDLVGLVPSKSEENLPENFSTSCDNWC